ARPPAAVGGVLRAALSAAASPGPSERAGTRLSGRLVGPAMVAPTGVSPAASSAPSPRAGAAAPGSASASAPAGSLPPGVGEPSGPACGRAALAGVAPAAAGAAVTVPAGSDTRTRRVIGG